jgi:BlaI family penicillinase repressor
MKRKPIAQTPTPGEFRLLDGLWRNGPSTIEELIDAMPESPPLNYKTVQTLLRIMERKGFVEHSVRSRAFVFRPLIERDQLARKSVSSLIERYFAGSASKLLINVVQKEEITAAELKELEALIRSRRTTETGQNSRRTPGK